MVADRSDRINHPNIATVHGFDSEGETRFLVMELVEGEDLDQRIERGPIPVDETVALFIQVAEGLEAAHDKGIVHRDLKPANLMVTGEGRLKILDFGLAKGLHEVSAGADSSESPTLTSAATARGEIMGTAPYMSPEQARGKPVDRRSDIWAFGVCLFEALSGQRPFSGETPMDTLSQVIQAEVPWEVLPGKAPRAIHRVLRRCLVADPKQRLHDIADARIELQATGSESGSFASVGEAQASRGRSAQGRKGALLAAGIAGLLLGALFTIAGFGLRGSTEIAADERAVRRSSINIDGLPLEPWSDLVALSPDGSMLAITAGIGRSEIYLRPLDSLELRAVEGAEGGWRPAFSPDGEWLTFWSFGRGQVKLPVSGGEVIQLAPAPDGWGQSWSEDGWIYYVPSNTSGIYRVRPSGGEPEQLTTVDSAAGEMSHRFPVALPGGRGVIFTVISEEFQSSRYGISALDLQDDEIVPLVDRGMEGRYAANGHLVFARNGTLYAAKIDLESLQLNGSAVPILTEVWMDFERGSAAYALSDDGTLVYVPLSSRNVFDTSPQWVERATGKVAALPTERRSMYTPRVSPNGSSLLFEVGTTAENISVYDLERGIAAQLAEEGLASTPIWSPDGKHIIFRFDREGPPNLYSRSADGAGPIVRLTSGEVDDSPSSWSSKGVVAFTRMGDRGIDVWTLEVTETGQVVSGAEPTPFLATPVDEAQAVFSPDGEWIAWEQQQGDRVEIMVQRYPEGSPLQLSRQGGLSPIWSRSDPELFYLEGGERLMVVSYEIKEEGFVATAPRELLELRPRRNGWPAQLFDVSPAGDRFFIAERPDLSKFKVVMVENWFAELERLVAAH